MTSYEYDIVCNYSRDKIKFDLNKSTTSYVKTSLTFPFSLLQFYVNNFRIFSGSNFYFDYTTEDTCFIYYDLSNMKCLKAKVGYAVY